MKVLLTTATLVIATVASAFAADVYVPVPEQFPEEYFDGNKAAGYVDLHYGFAWLDSEDESELHQAGVAARGNLPFSPASLFNLQLDGTAETMFVTGDQGKAGNERGATPIEATAHLYIRDPSRYAVGVFGSYGVAQGQNIWGGGIEGQLFVDRLTLYGQGGYRQMSVPCCLANDAYDEWYIRGVGRWFPAGNLRLEGEIGYAWYDRFGDKTNNLFWSAAAEYRFDHMPLGAYAQYRGNSYSGDYDYTSNAILLGVRAHLGSDSLFDNDRRGASFDTRAPDPYWYGMNIEF